MKPVTLPLDIPTVVNFALAEDIGDGDITAELISATKTIRANIISRDTGILCGKPWAVEIFNQLDNTVNLSWHADDGDTIENNQTIVTLEGSARSILTAERTILNFMQTLSATATLSHSFASMVKHTKVKLLDTRKTLPGLRTAQKYAVSIGGCHNHRMGLWDAFLIKENHIAACGGIEPAISNARALYEDRPVEIEVQSLDELDEAIQSAADIIMLDNFEIPDIIKAVAANNHRCKLEASGGIDDGKLVKIAETGVDYISIGALTKNCTAFDLSLLVQ
ncbi:MAG: nicotinate-nucleotide diphosphorylase (carboxylating) [SAR86 cluster bacterium]|uniref:Probable nicotinate-nucleotide pyrophosphorylase [carboxylating] n=1 Tax=SAR86 cluster bacterium TaxID=2030880 RepID=A0A2A5B041_9GAMM|nr:MAG: nicotinate-nucleotide diphosphorylase (carboxylating) [SAR86 cluster bacterium]